MQLFKALNLAVAFFLEIGMLAAYAYWGFNHFKTMPLKVSAGVGLPVLVITLWAIYAAPKSNYRLDRPGLILFQIVIFGLATYALYKAGQPSLALMLGGVWVISTMLGIIWKQ